MKKHNGMRPQDIFILLKIISLHETNWLNIHISRTLNISASEVSEALERCRIAKLIDSSKRRINVLALEEFLIHGIKYVFPVQLGTIARGVPTAFSASPIKDKIYQGSEVYVWAYKFGTVKGLTVEPLYKSIPEACLKDDKLYELLVIVDTLRIGRSRETEIAIAELKKILTEYAKSQY
ncbi:MAG TPA: hypothetical protein IAA88_05330 [Candidatus Avimuribaculum pullicola]|nr:hypothetical protein [Candidatus Avimuribaculum pullicola]